MLQRKKQTPGSIDDKLEKCIRRSDRVHVGNRGSRGTFFFFKLKKERILVILFSIYNSMYLRECILKSRGTLEPVGESPKITKKISLKDVQRMQESLFPEDSRIPRAPMMKIADRWDQ